MPWSNWGNYGVPVDYPQSGGGIDWQPIIQTAVDRGFDVLGATYGHGGYVSPDDPRYRAQGGYYPQPYGYDPRQSGASASVGLDPYGNARAGFTLNNDLIKLGLIVGGALVVGMLLSGKKGGR